MKNPITPPKRNVQLIRLFSLKAGVSDDEAYDFFTTPAVLGCIMDSAAFMEDTMLAERMSELYKTQIHLPADEHLLFDRKAFLSKLSGKQETVLRLLHHFLELHSSACSQITSFVEAKEYLQARSILHDIIGISGNLCCDRLYAAASALRLDCIAETGASLRAFQDTWQQTVDILQTYLLLHSEEKHPDAGREPFSKKWAHFSSLCSNCDIAAADYFDEHRDAFRAAFDNETFHRIEDAVKRYDLFYIAENITCPSEGA